MKKLMKSLLKTWRTLSKLEHMVLKVFKLKKKSLNFKSKSPLKLKEKGKEDLLPLKVLMMNPLGLVVSLIISP